MKPTFFKTAAAWRAWLEKHHGLKKELLVGFYKTGSGRPSMTWPESVDEALCFGWIDGVRRSLDEESYTIRFSPRKAASIWSAVNIAKMEMLIAADKVQAAGHAVFAARDKNRVKRYSFEQAVVAFDASREKQFKAEAVAWTFFIAQAPSYRKAVTWWVMSAKQETTRQKRLGVLMEHSAAGVRIK